MKKLDADFTKLETLLKNTPYNPDPTKAQIAAIKIHDNGQTVAERGDDANGMVIAKWQELNAALLRAKNAVIMWRTLKPPVTEEKATEFIKFAELMITNVTFALQKYVEAKARVMAIGAPVWIPDVPQANEVNVRAPPTLQSIIKQLQDFADIPEPEPTKLEIKLHKLPDPKRILELELQGFEDSMHYDYEELESRLVALRALIQRLRIRPNWEHEKYEASELKRRINDFRRDILWGKGYIARLKMEIERQGPMNALDRVKHPNAAQEKAVAAYYKKKGIKPPPRRNGARQADDGAEEDRRGSPPSYPARARDDEESGEDGSPPRYPEQPPIAPQRRQVQQEEKDDSPPPAYPQRVAVRQPVRPNPPLKAATGAHPKLQLIRLQNFEAKPGHGCHLEPRTVDGAMSFRYLACIARAFNKANPDQAIPVPSTKDYNHAEFPAFATWQTSYK